jgi:KDO2-lipid IV(A) lauroyltransferase
MTDLLIIGIIRLFQQFLRVLPEGLAHLVGVSLGRIAFVAIPGRRKVAIANTRRIIPGVSNASAAAVARRSFEKLGINFVEVLLLPYLPKEEYGRRFRAENRTYVDTALSANKGILALVFHYSNWEIMGIATFLLGREIVALARPLKGHGRLDAFFNGLRASTGLTVLPNQDSARDVLRLLGENRIIALLGDQREKRSKGVWVDLFGQKVPTSKGIVALAMKTGAPVIPVYAKREGFLRYSIVYNQPIFIERKGAPIAELIHRNARRMNEFLENVVLQNPEEWFLVHRRFGRNVKNNSQPAVQSSTTEKAASRRSLE